MAIRNKQTKSQPLVKPTPQPIPIPKETPINSIPSPSKVKSTPVSFSKEELNKLVNLKDQITQLSVEFGTLAISKIKLEEQEIILKAKLDSLEKEEKLIAKNLTDKYGKGSIDLNSGTFTPIE